jgi:hypothetical protein
MEVSRQGGRRRPRRPEQPGAPWNESGRPAVFFPSDGVGGWLLAEPIVEELKKSPAFRARVQTCRAELRPFGTKPKS